MQCEQAMDMMAGRDGASRMGDAAGLATAAALTAAEALSHVLGCGACLARLDQLGRAVLSPLEDELACAECRERLPSLRAALAANNRAVDGRASPADVERRGLLATLSHLRRCPYCAEELAALDAAMSAWEAGALPVLAEEPVLDLSFLDQHSVQVERAPELWLAGAAEAAQAAREVAGSVRTLFADVWITLRAGRAAFGRMPGPLAQTPLPARAMRAAGAPPAGETLVIPDADADLSIQLAIGPMVDQRAVVDLLLRQDADRAPLADTRVVLYDGEERLLASAVTAADGRAQFRDLGQGRYLFELRRPGRRWRLPLRVTAEGSESAD
jgi:hypothetical protein